MSRRNSILVSVLALAGSLGAGLLLWQFLASDFFAPFRMFLLVVGYGALGVLAVLLLLFAVFVVGCAVAALVSDLRGD